MKLKSFKGWFDQVPNFLMRKLKWSNRLILLSSGETTRCNGTDTETRDYWSRIALDLDKGESLKLRWDWGDRFEEEAKNQNFWDRERYNSVQKSWVAIIFGCEFNSILALTVFLNSIMKFLKETSINNALLYKTSKKIIWYIVILLCKKLFL